MKGRRFVRVWAVLALLVSLGIGVGGASSAMDELSTEAALGTVFTYQGLLRDGNGPVNATCDLQFKLWDAEVGGAQVGDAILLEDVLLEEGLFTARLDFGAAAFQGQARYLEVSVSCPVGSAFVPLPRQELTGSPYALWALGAPWTGLEGVPADLADGDQDTTYTAGTGLALEGTEFLVDTAQIQARVSEFCATGNAIRAVNADGSVTCETDDNTIYSAGPGLVLEGTVFVVDTVQIQARVSETCAAGSSIRTVAEDGTVVCEEDTDTTYTPGTGLSLVDGQFIVNFAGSGTATTASHSDHNHDATYVNEGQISSVSTGMVQNNTLLLEDLNQNGCSADQVIKWNGSAWACAADATGETSFWSLTGNAETTPGTNYLGTSDNVALELRVNGARALRLEPASSPNLLGGYSSNQLTAGVVGATVSGGGSSGYANRATDSYGTVGGGSDNQAGDGDGDVTDSRYCTVGGGSGNTASGEYATVPGGSDNEAAGDYSFAAGRSAKATYSGSFVWADAIDADFASTVDNQFNARASGGFRFWVDTSATGLRLFPVTDAFYGSTVNVIAGHGGNHATGGVIGATVSGGGYDTGSNGVWANFGTVGGGGRNVASGGSATVSGGWANGASGYEATVGGGSANIASGGSATVGGGGYNEASEMWAAIGGGGYNTASGGSATVGGGWWNEASGTSATVGGGQSNTVTDDYGTIAGGYNNQAGDDVGTPDDRPYAAVGGGRDNVASGAAATVAGGDTNIASGWRSTVSGGAGNIAAGAHSFAAGRQAQANNEGCFVWGDSYAGDVTCSNDNRTIFRSTGGFYIYTNTELSTGAYIPAGSNSWNVVSDRATKESFRPVDAQALLDTLAAMPIQEYTLRSQDPSIRHIGPVAQDFAVFGYGESDRAINLEDADGVALATIQALYVENQALRAENVAQQDQLEDLESRLAGLEAGHGAGGATARLPSGWLLLGGGVLAAGAVVGRRAWGGGR